MVLEQLDACFRDLTIHDEHWIMMPSSITQGSRCHLLSFALEADLAHISPRHEQAFYDRCVDISRRYGIPWPFEALKGEELHNAVQLTAIITLVLLAKLTSTRVSVAKENQCLLPLKVVRSLDGTSAPIEIICALPHQLDDLVDEDTISFIVKNSLILRTYPEALSRLAAVIIATCNEFRDCLSRFVPNNGGVEDIETKKLATENAAKRIGKCFASLELGMLFPDILQSLLSSNPA